VAVDVPASEESEESITADWIMKSMKALASRIVGQIGDETEVVTEIPNLTLHRFDEPTKPTGYLLEPSVCMILQGLSAWSLATMITSTMRPAFFVTSIDLPLIAQILEASPSDPYVGMTLKLDRMQIAQLILDSQLPSLNSGKASRAIELGALSEVSEASIPIRISPPRLVELQRRSVPHVRFAWRQPLHPSGIRHPRPSTLLPVGLERKAQSPADAPVTEHVD
jgi:hypothetical protein